MLTINFYNDIIYLKVINILQIKIYMTFRDIFIFIRMNNIFFTLYIMQLRAEASSTDSYSVGHQFESDSCYQPKGFKFFLYFQNTVCLLWHTIYILGVMIAQQSPKLLVEV